jgi:hypothetical protein
VVVEKAVVAVAVAAHCVTVVVPWYLVVHDPHVIVPALGCSVVVQNCGTACVSTRHTSR